MDFQSFGRDALDLVARRSLDVLRDFDPSRLRRLAMEKLSPAPSPVIPIAAGVGGLVVGAAIGAGIAMFVTPVSGPVMRRRLASQTKRARARAMEMGRDARGAIDESITSASTALGIQAPKRSRRSASSKANGRGRRHPLRSSSNHASA